MLGVQSKLVFRYIVHRDSRYLISSVARVGGIYVVHHLEYFDAAVSLCCVKYHPPARARAHGDVRIRCRHLAGRTPKNCVFTDICTPAVVLTSSYIADYPQNLRSPCVVATQKQTQ